jgi:hypothetical protein
MSLRIVGQTVISARRDICTAFYEQPGNVSESLPGPRRSWTPAERGRVNLKKVAFDYPILCAAMEPRSRERAKSA